MGARQRSQPPSPEGLFVCLWRESLPHPLLVSRVFRGIKPSPRENTEAPRRIKKEKPPTSCRGQFIEKTKRKPTLFRGSIFVKHGGGGGSRTPVLTGYQTAFYILSFLLSVAPECQKANLAFAKPLNPVRRAGRCGARFPTKPRRKYIRRPIYPDGPLFKQQPIRNC